MGGAGGRGAPPACAAVEANPDDPAAHDLLGAWYCLVQDDWATGLGHVARGGNVQLRALARAEWAPTGADVPAPANGSAPAAVSKDPLARGDAWWDAAAEQTDARLVALGRAGYWYRRVAPGTLGGLRKLHVERRLEVIIDVEHTLAARRAALQPPPSARSGAAWREGW